MLVDRLRRLAAVAKEARLAGKAALPNELRREVVRTVLWLDAPKLRPLPNPIRLLGLEIAYFGWEQFRYLFREIFVEASYLFRADDAQPLIIDCGSNIGMSIMFFKKLYPAARIVGFEPDPATFDKLRTNVERNALASVAVHRCALGSEDGTIPFYRDGAIDGSLLMSVRRERMDGEAIAVPVRRLSSYISEPVDLLKIDVEGAEEAVFADLAAHGKLRLIKQIHLEYHHHIEPTVDRLSAMLKLLEEHGFGYQMQARPEHWPAPGQFQDVAIYCYRR